MYRIACTTSLRVRSSSSTFVKPMSSSLSLKRSASWSFALRAGLRGVEFEHLRDGGEDFRGLVTRPDFPSMDLMVCGIMKSFVVILEEGMQKTSW